MKITTSLTQTREIEIPVPSFYKDTSTSILDVVGILDEKTVVRVWDNKSERIFIENGIPERMSNEISKAFNLWQMIPEEEFFTHYNNAMESLSLTPKLTEQ